MRKFSKVAGALAGNAMEFYDFTIYAFLATYIGKEFFNFDDSFLSYFITIAIFTSGYLTRPLGALLFGYIGDKKGRSKALSISIIISTAATFLMGIVPGHEKIGIFAPMILICLRLLQGIAVSGEGGAIVLLFERYSFKNKGIIGSYVLASTLFGVILGSIICAITSWLVSEFYVSSWAWRLPFLLALPFGMVAILLRYLLNDFSLFKLAEVNELTLRRPIKTLIKKYSHIILYGVCIVSLYSLTTSTLIVHFPYLLTAYMGLTNYHSLLILTMFLIVISIMTPIFGKIISPYNPMIIYKISALLIMLAALFLFHCIAIKNIGLVLLIALIFSILTALISSTLYPIFVGIFPFGVRYTGVAFSFNLSVTLFSSTTPMAMLFLENYFKNVFVSGAYLCLLISMSLLLPLFITKSRAITYFNQTEKELLLYGGLNNEFTT